MNKPYNFFSTILCLIIYMKIENDTLVPNDHSHSLSKEAWALNFSLLLIKKKSLKNKKGVTYNDPKVQMQELVMKTRNLYLNNVHFNYWNDSRIE